MVSSEVEDAKHDEGLDLMADKAAVGIEVSEAERSGAERSGAERSEAEKSEAENGEAKMSEAEKSEITPSTADIKEPEKSGFVQQEAKGGPAYIVVSISGTGGEQMQYTAKDASEIIEIAWRIVSAKDLTQVAAGSELVKPINTPITPLCTSVTGLTWSSVKDAKTLKDAIEKFSESIHEHLIATKRPFSFVTFSSWDLRMRLPKEAREKSIQLPDYMRYPRYFDLRKEFVRYQETTKDEFYSNSSINEITIGQVVELLGVGTAAVPDSCKCAADSGEKDETSGYVAGDGEFRNGGSSASKTTSLLVEIMRKLKQEAGPELRLLSRPHDMGLDLTQFYEDGSRILYITNLPLDVTQSELESWFTQFGCKPMAFWTIKAPLPEMGSSNTSNSNNNNNNNNYNTSTKYNNYNNSNNYNYNNNNYNNNNNNNNYNYNNNNYNNSNSSSLILHSTCSGFVIFASHDAAAESLAMNGRVLNDRIIEVQPSSAGVLDKAQEILTPFPSSKNRPRPGDWTCPSCGFSNFQRRTACFRCSFPATSAQAVQESKYAGPGYYTGGPGGYAAGSYGASYGRATGGPGGPGGVPGATGQHHHAHQNGHRGVHQGAHQALGGSATRGYSAYGGQPAIGSSNVPFRAGDWKCMNENCAYHNFAKNVCCLKCGAPRVASAILSGHPHTPRHANQPTGPAAQLGRITPGYQAHGQPFRPQNIDSHRSYSQPYPQQAYQQFSRPILSQGSTPVLADSSVDNLSSQITGLSLSRPDQPASQVYGTLANLSGSSLSLNPDQAQKY